MWGTFSDTDSIYSIEKTFWGLQGKNQHKGKRLQVLGPVHTSSQGFIGGCVWSFTPTYHFCGGLCVLCSHVLLQGDLCVAHPAAVGTCEGLGLLHWERFATIVQVWRGIKMDMTFSVNVAIPGAGIAVFLLHGTKVVMAATNHKVKVVDPGKGSLTITQS